MERSTPDRSETHFSKRKNGTRIDAALEHAASRITGLASTGLAEAGFAADFAALQAMDDPFAGPPDDQRRIDYLPTPDEIRDACLSIRQGWTRSEKRRRFVGDDLPDDEERAWQPPLVDTSYFRAASSRTNSEHAG